MKARSHAEARLVRGARQGDEAAFARLVELHGGWLRTLAERHRGPLDIEDALQWARLGLWEAVCVEDDGGRALTTRAGMRIRSLLKRARFGPEGDPMRALRCKANRVALRVLQEEGRGARERIKRAAGVDTGRLDAVRRAVEQRAPQDEAALIAEARSAESLEDVRRVRERVQRAVAEAGLSPREAAVLEARVVEGSATLEETARALGAGRATVARVQREVLARVRVRLLQGTTSPRPGIVSGLAERR